MDTLWSNITSNAVTNGIQFIVQSIHRRRSNIDEKIDLCRRRLHDHVRFALSYSLVPANRESTCAIVAESNENNIVNSLIALDYFLSDPAIDRFIRRIRASFANLRTCSDYLLPSKVSDVMGLMDEVMRRYCQGGD